MACSGKTQSREEAEAQNTKPNIIYILADDLGYGDLSCYGQTKFTTPHLDKMAAEGMRFTQHYAGSPVCAPSRAALMTGLHTGHTRVRGNYEVGPHGFGAGVALKPEDITVAEVLKKAGYKTGLVGKWGLGVAGTTGEPQQKGFDYMFGFLNQGHAHFHYPEYLYRNGQKVELPGNQNGKREQYAQDLFHQEALQFLDNNKNGQAPFFLYLALTVPHAEMLHPDDENLARFKGKFPEKPFVKKTQGKRIDDSLGTYNSSEMPHAAFAAMVTRLDAQVGQLLTHLKKLGLDKNTIVLFSSDNGPHKEAGADPVFFNSSGPLRGFKRDLYEGGIRVPLIVRWPGKIKAGSESNHISAFWDFMPTAAALAGTPSPATDGISFLPTLLGNTQDQQQHDNLYWEFHENKTSNQAVRQGDWKGIRHRPSGPLELYNLKTDLAEKNNVAEAHPEIVSRLETMLSKVRTPSEIWSLKDDRTSAPK
ncbi:arylsulfatase [Adhaeribacter aerolatus]|uniref:Arylsulfatase n=1 Tax=Adhaeribacter aerolatus TaxID=670289 RepID=A0A512AZZ0_9BACT|nr:arylsulfatase [Adhaeribacter aerolatus]